MDVYNAYYDLAWSNIPTSLMEATATYFSDDFRSLNQDGEAEMNKEMYGGMSQLLVSAFSGFRYVIVSKREEGDSVIVNGHFEGTHTGDLDLSAMGLGVLPASGKMIVWPDSTVKFTVAGDKIVSLQTLDGGGTEAFLSVLRGTPPSA